MTLTPEWLSKFSWPLTLLTGHPLAIAHRGACDYAPENTLKAFQIAADLCAEMWELDVRLSADGVCVVCHDDNLERVSGHNLKISQSTWAQISAITLPEGQHVPRLEEVIALAKTTGCGLYIEVKGEGAGIAAWAILQKVDFKFAVLGSFNVPWIAELKKLGCDYPLSVLVPLKVDPVEYLNGVAVDIVHICWRKASNRPDTLLTKELMQRLTPYQIVLWDEDRLEVIEKLLDKSVMGICSNRPEMLKPYRPDPDHPIEIVCHRGANNLAPENTLEAARICLDQKFQFVELDVRTTSDKQLAVIHDGELERTTEGAGLVVQHTLAQIQALDAGRWFRQNGAGHQVPSLPEFFELARGKAGIYVEIKQADAEQLLGVVKQFDMLDQCFFWSADIGTLVDLRRLQPGINLMVPRWIFSSIDVAVAAYGAQIVEFDVERDDLWEIGRCAELGVRSMIYSRRSDWDELASYLKLKPDMVNLDFPDRFKILVSYPLVRKHFEAMTCGLAFKEIEKSGTKPYAVNS